ncbi:hypothetical protein KUTeg_006042 [Tegillarca granosa]|uniref:Uncharacterized protein n=1 Tax=Tegillarca granosa TaxID=220873 RepID=A0ABQ9FFB2_TEGGR|nr:hypothetical protein KUTeg_006042 [Tegillarca granosa]
MPIVNILVLVAVNVLFLPATITACLPPTDFKAIVLNNYRDLQLTWKKPTTGPEVVGFVIYINKFNNRTKEPTYLIRNAQYQVYKISIDSNCGQFGYSSRYSVNIGFVGKAVYSTVGQSRVDIDWKLTCDSQKTSKPDYYTPELNYTWFLNGSIHIYKQSHQGRYSQIQNKLIIDNITRQDKDGPEIVILIPDTKDNVLKVGEKFGPINCSAECNPYCIFSWKFRKPGDTGRREEITRSNILTIDKITRKNAGEYRCAVRSSDSNTLPQTNTKTIDLNPEIKNITYLLNGSAKLVINNGQVLTVSANDDINLQCNIEANPKASISWKRNGKPKQSMLSPVRNRYGSKINSTVNVSLSIIAYPRPQHRWTSNTTGTIIERPTSEINLYSFNYESLVNIRRATDFGNYCLNLTNDKGSSLVCLQIQAEDVPLAPTNFTAESILPEMINLTWISQFNGGQEQTFYLEYKQKGDNSGFKKINMSDNGSGETIRASVKNLKSNAVYIFRLYSRNNIGNSSIKNLEVKTEAYPIKEPLSSNLTATLAGGIFAIAIVLVIVIIVIVIIRRRSSTNDNEISQGGANIDVVYGKVDKVNKSKKNEIKQNGASADVVYSEVQNPKNQTQQNGASADAVYSEYKNEEGLIYIDVDVRGKKEDKKKGKPVVHGDEDRTEYISIDFTKKAES